MWTDGAWLLVWAADAPTGSGSGGDQLAIIVSGLVGTTIVAAGGVIVALINARSGRAVTTPDPVPGVGALDPAEIRRRLDDSDERDELQDRRHERHERAMDRFADRLERVEHHLDRTDPGWRRDS